MRSAISSEEALALFGRIDRRLIPMRLLTLRHSAEQGTGPSGPTPRQASLHGADLKGLQNGRTVGPRSRTHLRPPRNEGPLVRRRVSLLENHPTGGCYPGSSIMDMRTSGDCRRFSPEKPGRDHPTQFFPPTTQPRPSASDRVRFPQTRCQCPAARIGACRGWAARLMPVQGRAEGSPCTDYRHVVAPS